MKMTGRCDVKEMQESAVDEIMKPLATKIYMT